MTHTQTRQLEFLTRETFTVYLGKGGQHQIDLRYFKLGGTDLMCLSAIGTYPSLCYKGLPYVPPVVSRFPPSMGV